ERVRPPVGEPLLGGVAGGAGDRAVLAEPRIKIELAAEIDLRLRDRILVGDVGGAGLQPQRQDEAEVSRGERLAGRRLGLRLLRRLRWARAADQKDHRQRSRRNTQDHGSPTSRAEHSTRARRAGRLDQAGPTSTRASLKQAPPETAETVSGTSAVPTRPFLVCRFQIPLGRYTTPVRTSGLRRSGTTTSPRSLWTRTSWPSRSRRGAASSGCISRRTSRWLNSPRVEEMVLSVAGEIRASGWRPSAGSSRMTYGSVPRAAGHRSALRPGVFGNTVANWTGRGPGKSKVRRPSRRRRSRRPLPSARSAPAPPGATGPPIEASASRTSASPRGARSSIPIA